MTKDNLRKKEPSTEDELKKIWADAFAQAIEDFAAGGPQGEASLKVQLFAITKYGAGKIIHSADFKSLLFN